MNRRNLILVEPAHRDCFKPLTWARPLSSFRIGICTIAEKWALQLHAEVSPSCPDYLAEKFPVQIGEDNIIIPAHVLPGKELCHIINQLSFGEMLVQGDQMIAVRLDRQKTSAFLKQPSMEGHAISQLDAVYVRALSHLWELFQWNAYELEQDFELVTSGRQSGQVHESNVLLGDRVFIEEGTRIRASVINSEMGPVYIGKYAEIMEGSMIRGPFALCEKGQLKMGTKVYGPTTIGPGCRVGGEINNSIVQGFSNKAHDGFLGNSIVGEWCNIGADSNNSNLKNNYEEVKLWNYQLGRFEATGTQFCGLIMGDHAKCGINTMFNTGTVVGYGANVFGSGYPRQFIPDFAWGGAAGYSTFQLEKFFDTAQQVLLRRDQDFGDDDQRIAQYIFKASSAYRSWEKSDTKL